MFWGMSDFIFANLKKMYTLPPVLAQSERRVQETKVDVKGWSNGAVYEYELDFAPSAVDAMLLWVFILATMIKCVPN